MEIPVSTIKTTKQAAKNAYRTAKALRKAAEKSAKTAEKATEKVVKAAAKTTVSVAKAMIVGTKALLVTIAAGGWIAILVMVIVLLFGAAISMMGGENSTTVSPVSAGVQSYEPLIRKYAKQYGIGEYVELIKAVMMQESGGQGNDLMQSSEGSFNTKYPKKPNGITDSEYSIECGVQEIKSCLASAEVKSPVDMDNIKLALQGYNYGNGCIQWAGGTGTGRERWGHLLEMVWIYQPDVMACLFCVVVRGAVRLSGKRCHAEVFSLFGRCEMVSGERAV